MPNSVFQRPSTKRRMLHIRGFQLTAIQAFGAVREVKCLRATECARGLATEMAWRWLRSENGWLLESPPTRWMDFPRPHSYSGPAKAGTYICQFSFLYLLCRGAVNIRCSWWHSRWRTQHCTPGSGMEFRIGSKMWSAFILSGSWEGLNLIWASGRFPHSLRY